LVCRSFTQNEHARKVLNDALISDGSKGISSRPSTEPSEL
jgi:hypothetical protein